MAKVKTSFFCQSCGYESPKWLGKCPSCNQWNTFAEEIQQKPGSNDLGLSTNRVNEPKRITEIEDLELERTILSDPELNRVLGGGLVPGSLVLLGGDPGIGKSTLSLQMAMQFPKNVLYVSGEESESQIAMRAQRLELSSESCFILSETNTKNIFVSIDKTDPELIVIDSIQTLQSPLIESTPGSVSQVKQCTAELMRFAKESRIPVLIVGHITKDGMLAGPKVLEHMVDTVLQFEGDRNHVHRILRSVKNRFGSTSELGIYEMTQQGLLGVENPSEILMTDRDTDSSGVSIASIMEGNRPLMIEIQSLASPSTYGTPQRSTTGFDQKRLHMLLAVLEKRCGFKMGMHDVFVNVAGGLKIEDTAADLAICMAIISSFEDVYISEKYCFIGEVGLGGEVRPVAQMERRVNEAHKLGFERVYMSKFVKDTYAIPDGIKVITVGNVSDLLRR